MTLFGPTTIFCSLVLALGLLLAALTPLHAKPSGSVDSEAEQVRPPAAPAVKGASPSTATAPTPATSALAATPKTGGAATATGGAATTTGGAALLGEDPNYRYSAVNKRDPFKSPLSKIKESLRAANENDPLRNMPQREKEPLEAFPLDSLKLVAFLTVSSKTLAMVQDPTGKGFIVWVGNYMGDKNGQVMRIDNGELELLEDAPTPEDTTATRITILKMHKEE